jgi:hypothetical protein
MLSAAALVVIPSAIEEEASAQNANDTSTTTTAAAATIQLTATQVNGTYLWIDSNGMYNPTLVLKQIQITQYQSKAFRMIQKNMN